MKKMVNFLSIIFAILMVLSTYISNYYGILICGGLSILSFATCHKASIGYVLAYLLTITTIIFKLSMVYNFSFSINVSQSYIYLSMGISAILCLFVFFYNCVSLKRE